MDGDELTVKKTSTSPDGQSDLKTANVAYAVETRVI